MSTRQRHAHPSSGIWLRAVLCAVLISLFPASAFGQPVVSEKQDIAIFALGYYGWSIPDRPSHP